MRSLALVGTNGGGKSTLLRMVSGLERPDRGSVWFRGTGLLAGAAALLGPGARSLLGHVR